MNRLTNQIFQISVFLVTAFLLFSCSSEPHDDAILKEKLGTQSNELKTVPLENSLNFFKKLNSNQLTKRDSDTTGIGLVIDLESLEQVDVTDTDAKLNIASATTEFEGVETEILQIEIDGELQTVLFHHVPEDSNTNKKTNKIASESFTGSVYSTDLGGRVLSGFKISGGTVSGQYNFGPLYSGDPPVKLKEVIIKNTYIAPTIANNNIGTMMDYQFVRSNNNGSTMGIAYAAYFKYLAERTPCDQMKNIIDPANSSNMKSQIDWLKGKVNATVNNRECSVEVKRTMNPDGTFKFEYTQIISENEFSSPMTTGGSNIGGAHSHPENGYAMFSFGDVKLLLDAYNGAFPSKKIDAFIMVVCKDNAGITNTYNLKVDNIDALNSHILSVWNDPKYASYTTEKEKIDAIHLDQARIYKNSNGELEKSFLDQFKDFGISLYKADAALSSFNKLALNSSKTVISTPCN